MPPVTYFYHSFPRRPSKSTLLGEPKGERILRLMTQFGFVLTPEVTTWVERSRNTQKQRLLKTLQQRFCLTELSPSELRGHASLFGRYALEFDIATGRRLGAMPVFYVSTIDPPVGFEAMGASTAFRIDELRKVLDRIARILGLDESSDLAAAQFLERFQCPAGTAQAMLSALFHGFNSPQELRSLLGGVLGLFYPLDHKRYTRQLGYYRQREWRIAGRLSLIKERVVVDAPVALRRELKHLDKDFFCGTRTFDGRWVVANRCLLYPSLLNKHVMEYVRRVVCPATRVRAVIEILRTAGFKSKVVALEDL